MNAAFLLMTTACIAGADAAPQQAAPPAAAPVHSVSMGTCGGGCAGCGGCDSGCGTCCDACGESGGLLSRLKGRFHRGDDCGCDSGGGLLSKLKGRFHKSECGCESSCGCDSGCSSCGGGYGGAISPVPGAIMPRAEPIGPPKEEPKKLPSGEQKQSEEKKGGSVQLIPQPIGNPALRLSPTAGYSRD